MIFVSMDSHELLPRTNAYRVCEDPSAQLTRHHDPSLSEELPVLDLDTGELLSEDHRPPSRRADASTRRTVPPPISNSHTEASTRRTVPPPISNSQPSHSAPLVSARGRRSRSTLVPPASLYRSVRVLPGPVTSNESSDEDEVNVTGLFEPRPPPPPAMDHFTVTTDCSEPTSDVEEPSSAITLADLMRRDRAALYAETSDNESTTEDPEITRILNNGRARLSGVRLSRSNRHDLRRELPSRIEVMHDWDPGHGSEYGPLAELGLTPYEKCMIETKAQMKGVLAPHARFFIEKEASCVTVNFEPTVSVLSISIFALPFPILSLHSSSSFPQFILILSIDLAASSSSRCGARPSSTTSIFKASLCTASQDHDFSQLYSHCKGIICPAWRS